MSSPTPIQLAVVGGRRAFAFADVLPHLAERAVLTAVCDLDSTVLDAWQRRAPHVRTYTSYAEMLDRAGCDAVFVATPLPLHATHSIQALAAGKHVLSEVTAVRTLDEAWALVEAVERSGKVYMMAENYCYMRANRLVRNMARHGLFGEITYAEGAYIHDCCALLLDDQEKLTWRGQYRRDMNGNSYPTHSLGPVAQWLGIHQTDRLASTASFVTREEATRRYMAKRLGADHTMAQEKYFQLGDSTTTVIRTEQGAVIVLRVDWASPRPHNMTHYVLQGSRGAYLSPRYHGEDPLIWIEGLSPGSSPPSKEAGEAEWEPLWRYADRYEDDLWREYGPLAASVGHGGGDFFVLAEFADTVQQGKRPPIDVYDAVAWSAIIPLSEESVRLNGAPVAVPDFRPSGGVRRTF